MSQDRRTIVLTSVVAAALLGAAGCENTKKAAVPAAGSSAPKAEHPKADHPK